MAAVILYSCGRWFIFLFFFAGVWSVWSAVAAGGPLRQRWGGGAVGEHGRRQRGPGEGLDSQEDAARPVSRATALLQVPVLHLTPSQPKFCCRKQALLERRKKMKRDSEYTWRELPQSLLHVSRGHDGVLHRPDQSPVLRMIDLFWSESVISRSGSNSFRILLWIQPKVKGPAKKLK